jgi:hypothetical protein
MKNTLLRIAILPVLLVIMVLTFAVYLLSLAISALANWLAAALNQATTSQCLYAQNIIDFRKHHRGRDGGSSTSSSPNAAGPIENGEAENE